jgi:AraC-like DNA-binding protein
MAAVLTVVRRATGVADIHSFVELPHARPAETTAHARVFRGPVHFGASRARLAFRLASLARPLVSADDALSSLLRPVVSAALSDLVVSDDVVERARAKTIRALGDGGASLVSLARALGTSSRSLQRALAARGTTYQQVLDEARRDLALRYVADPGRPLGEIAPLLAFSRTSAFHRAFRRWTGRTPMAYRGAAGLGAPTRP